METSVLDCGASERRFAAKTNSMYYNAGLTSYSKINKSQYVQLCIQHNLPQVRIARDYPENCSTMMLIQSKTRYAVGKHQLQ